MIDLRRAMQSGKLIDVKNIGNGYVIRVQQTPNTIEEITVRFSESGATDNRGLKQIRIGNVEPFVREHKE